MFGFNQPKQAEVPDVPLNEQDTLDKCQEKISNQFYEVYKQIKANRVLINQLKKPENKKNEINLNSLIDESMQNISSLFEQLIACGRQIDTGNKMLKEFENDLNISKSDFENQKLNDIRPSPFLLKFVDELEKDAEELSQSIASYSSHLQSQVSTSDSTNKFENQVVFNFLKEQRDAIYRCSTKIDKLKEKHNQVKRLLAEKLKISTHLLSIEDEITDVSVVQSINIKRQQFEQQKKQKGKKDSDNSDIFGYSTIQTSSTTNSFGFGGFNMFGNKP